MKEWIYILAILAFMFIAATLGGGCGQQVIIVPGNTPVQLAEPAMAYIYVRDPVSGQTIKSTNRATIPAGYVCFPPGLLQPTTRP